MNYILAGLGGDLKCADSMRIESGVEIHRFEKELIHTGKFEKDADGVSFEVTEETLEHFCKTFEEMQTNGIGIPLPKTHKISDNPDDSYGWLKSMRHENGKLIGEVDIIGEEGVEAAKKSQVSIYVPRTWKDGAGHTYARPILHVALTTRPVIPGMEEFKPLAASMLALTEENNAMDWKEIAEALGIEVPTGDDAKDLILSAVKDQGKTVVDLTAQLKAEKDTSAALKLSHESIKDVDPVLVDLSRDNRKTKINSLVEASKITPACAKAMEAHFIGEDNTALKLSLQRGGNDFDFIVGMLAENDPVKLGEKTPGQTLSLADQLKDQDDADPLGDDAEERADAAGKG